MAKMTGTTIENQATPSTWTAVGGRGEGNGLAGRAQRFQAAGKKMWGELNVSSYGNQQADPAVAADSLGNFVVVWQKMVKTYLWLDVFYEHYDVFGRLFITNGVGGSIVL